LNKWIKRCWLERERDSPSPKFIIKINKPQEWAFGKPENWQISWGRFYQFSFNCL
jgi:hypothetical protein